MRLEECMQNGDSVEYSNEFTIRMNELVKIKNKEEMREYCRQHSLHSPYNARASQNFQNYQLRSVAS